MTDAKLPECHEGDAAAGRFTDSLKTIFGLGPDRSAEIRAAARAPVGVKRVPATGRAGVSRSGSGSPAASQPPDGSPG